MCVCSRSFLPKVLGARDNVCPAVGCRRYLLRHSVVPAWRTCVCVCVCVHDLGETDRIETAAGVRRGHHRRRCLAATSIALAVRQAAKMKRCIKRTRQTIRSAQNTYIYIYNSRIILSPHSKVASQKYSPPNERCLWCFFRSTTTVIQFQPAENSRGQVLPATRNWPDT